MPTTRLPTVRTSHWTVWTCPCTARSKLNGVNMSEGPSTWVLYRGDRHPLLWTEWQTGTTEYITFSQLIWLAATKQFVALTFIMFTRQENFIPYFQRRIAFYSYPENCISNTKLLLWLRHLQLSVQKRSATHTHAAGSSVNSAFSDTFDTKILLHNKSYVRENQATLEFFLLN